MEDLSKDEAAALPVIDIKTYKFARGELNYILMKCQQLSQVKKAYVANTTLVVEVNMGPLQGDVLKQAIDTLFIRIIRIVNTTREARSSKSDDTTLHLVHSRS